MKLLYALLVLAGLGLGLSPVDVAGRQKDKGDKKETKGQETPGENLDGTWTVVEVVVAGKKVPDDSIKGVKMTVKGKAFTLETGGKAVKGTFKADASKTPKEVD